MNTQKTLNSAAKKATKTLGKKAKSGKKMLPKKANAKFGAKIFGATLPIQIGTIAAVAGGSYVLWSQRKRIAGLFTSGYEKVSDVVTGTVKQLKDKQAPIVNGAIDNLVQEETSAVKSAFNKAS